MNILLFLGIGLVVGVASGAMGIGGGVILVPLLTWLCGFELKRASGTSLALLAIPVTLPGAFKAYKQGHVDLEPVLWLAAGFMAGAFITREYIDYLPEIVLRRFFGLLMMYIGVRFLLASDAEAANAAAGLVAAAAAWLGFILLRALGRRHLVAPHLGDEIRRMRQEGRGDPDYYI